MGKRPLVKITAKVIIGNNILVVSFDCFKTDKKITKYTSFIQNIYFYNDNSTKGYNSVRKIHVWTRGGDFLLRFLVIIFLILPLYDSKDEMKSMLKWTTGHKNRCSAQYFGNCCPLNLY